MFIVGTLPLYKGGFEFSKSPSPPPKKKEGGGLDFTYKIGWLNRVVIFYKSGTLSVNIIIFINFESYLSLSE